MEDRTSYAVVPSSISHTFGNVTGFITEYVKGLFPKDYFKTVNIASMISYRHFNVLNNTNKDFIKKNKPMLIIRPRIDVLNNDVFLNGSLLTTRITDNFYDRDFGNLQPFVEDLEKGLGIRYLMNRIKMYFDVSIILESQIEQINQAIYLKNIVRQELPFFIETALESNVPREIMQGIAHDANIDINETKTLLDYLNSHSLYPVTYKLKNSTGNDEFFRYYPVQMDSIITGLSMDDGSKKGFVDDSYLINFTIETEFNTAGLYYYYTQEAETVQRISMNTDIGFSDTQNKVNPSFTIVDLFNQEPPPGWTLYTAPLYKVEGDESSYRLNFEQIINSSIEKTIKFHLEKGMDVGNVVRIFVIKDTEQLDETKGDFIVDYENLDLITNVVNTTSTYRMIVYVNTLYINTLVSDLLEFEKEK